ncbi:MAG: hypothetical protein DWQ37_22975 [Planctomycetota bacterium]|nr:MAG: hypothetical protein DWQ37_22975 [Planctomycetota bacterium]
MSAPKKRWTGWLILAVKLAVFGVLCWAIYRALESGRSQLSQHVWDVEPGWLVVSGLLYLLGILPSALFWHRVLLRTDQQAAAGEAVRAYYISQLGKYVPGKWMVILLRRMLLTTGQVENTIVAASVFFETFTMLAVGAAISAMVLLIWQTHQTLLIATAAGSVILLGAPTMPLLFEFLLRTLRVTRLNATAGAKFRQISWSMLAVGWAGIAFGWLMQGASLWATLRGLGATEAGPFAELPLNTAAVALSVVAGFLSQIPGGLAVREWVSAQLIEPVYGESMAIVSTIIYRLVLVVSELSVSIILYVAGWRRMPRLASGWLKRTEAHSNAPE